MDVVADWQSLRSSAIVRRHSGDIDGAIDDMTRSISLARTIPNFEEQTSTDLNYLADMYLECNDLTNAELAIREAIQLSRDHYPYILGSNLYCLAEIERRKGDRQEALSLAKEARLVYEKVGNSFEVTNLDKYIQWIEAETT